MVERYLFVPFFFVLTLLLFALAIRRVLGCASACCGRCSRR